MNGKIYKITNTETGESYVGQTINPVEVRFKQHFNGSWIGNKKQSKLQKAIAEYGINHFKIEILEENIPTHSELSAKENYYIIKYGTQNEYNSDFGNGPRVSRKDSVEHQVNTHINREKENKPKVLKKRKPRVRGPIEDLFSLKVNNLTVIFNNDFNKIITGHLSLSEYNLLIGLLGILDMQGNKIMKPDFYLLRQLSDCLSYHAYDLILSLKRLKNKLKSFTLLKSDNTQIPIQLFSLFEIDEDENTLHIQMNQDCLYLVNDFENGNYTTINFNKFISIKNFYAKTLFLLLSQFSSTGFCIIKLNTLKFIINCPTSYFKRGFNSKILTPAINNLPKEFNSLKVTKNKRGRSYTQYKFNFIRFFKPL